jgi:hypothetical protein
MMQKEYTRLVQLIHPELGRKIAKVEEPSLVLLTEIHSIYELALLAIGENQKLSDLVASRMSAEKLDYNKVYDGASAWKLLPSFDHPQHPSACLVSGTGLTHKNSALNRQMMHQATEQKLTDSMQMYQWGVEGGHPAENKIGVQPEWFYKGTGDVLRAHGEDLHVPCFGNDGGEEPEVAGVYIVDSKGKPWRIGLTTGNEFSDHVMEKKNYLYLAPSKLRNCSIGPELVLSKDFEEVSGMVSISRNKNLVWSSAIKSGEKNMAHSLANLEHHHFKYPGHQLPFQAHVHFYGADAFSFGSQLSLEEGDEMMVSWDGFGRPLKNKLTISKEKEKLERVESIL